MNAKEGQLFTAFENGRVVHYIYSNDKLVKVERAVEVKLDEWELNTVIEWGVCYDMKIKLLPDEKKLLDDLQKMSDKLSF